MGNWCEIKTKLQIHAFGTMTSFNENLIHHKGILKSHKQNKSFIIKNQLFSLDVDTMTEWLWLLTLSVLKVGVPRQAQFYHGEGFKIPDSK